jgi:hypothetical protein
LGVTVERDGVAIDTQMLIPPDVPPPGYGFTTRIVVLLPCTMKVLGNVAVMVVDVLDRTRHSSHPAE